MTSKVQPEIVVEISLLPTAGGGRQRPISEGEYRGILGVGQENFSVRFFVPLAGGLAPGASGKFGVQFLVPESALPYFRVGTSFTVWEGKIIGEGKVLEVIHRA